MLKYTPHSLNEYLELREKKNVSVLNIFFDESYSKEDLFNELSSYQEEELNASMMFILGDCYYSKFKLKNDNVIAMKWYKRASELGHACASNALGIGYLFALGVDRNYEEAIRLFNIASEGGSLSAYCNLGYCYQMGVGVIQDNDKAFMYYMKAKDYNVAMYNIGSCYMGGLGVAKDFEEGIRWHQKAAEEGYLIAIVRLAGRYLNGQGVTRDYDKAYKYFLMGVELEDAQCMYEISRMYYRGDIGGSEDEAIPWLIKAAEAGCVNAMWLLGKCYQGKVFNNFYDEEKSKYWLDKAYANGYKEDK